jgi:hypothetical protein
MRRLCLLEDRKQRKRGGDGITYEVMPLSDLLPPARPYHSRFLQPPKITPVLQQHSTYESVGDIAESSHDTLP